jgi:hypothetical protein
MPLNQKQLDLHWREFAAAKRACAAAGHSEPDRHALYVQALGKDKSLTKFNNGDLDKVLAVFRALSRPSDFDGQVELANMDRTRLEYSIRDLASQITVRPVHLADAYWQAIARDKFGLRYPANSAVRVEFSELSDLSIEQLTQLRNTLEVRLASKKKKERETAQSDRSAPSDQSDLLPISDDNVPF